MRAVVCLSSNNNVVSQHHATKGILVVAGVFLMMRIEQAVVLLLCFSLPSERSIHATFFFSDDESWLVVVALQLVEAVVINRSCFLLP